MTFASLFAASLFKAEAQYVDYYHFIVARLPHEPTIADRLAVAAFEAVNDDLLRGTGMGARNDGTPAKLKMQCARALPFYQMAKQRESTK